MQADGGFVQHVEHPHQAGADLRGEPNALRLAAGERAGSAVEVQVVEADAQQQLHAAADFAQDLPTGFGMVAGGLDGGQERMQLVEVHPPEVVDGAAGDAELQARRTQPGAAAIRTDVFDHHAIQPGLHAGARNVALAIAAIMALDAAGNALERILVPQPVFLAYLGIRRHPQLQRLALGAVHHQFLGFGRELPPRRLQAETVLVGQRVERVAAVVVWPEVAHVAQQAAVADAALGIGDEQIGMGALVRADAAAGAAGAFRIVEHEEVRHDVAVDQGMGGAAEILGERSRPGLRGAANYRRRQQRIAHPQRVFDGRFELAFHVRRDD